LIVEDTSKETRFAVARIFHDQGITSSMTVLIPGQKGPYGVLGTYTAQRCDFNSHQLHFLQSIANILGAAMERKKLEEQIFQSQKLELIGHLAAGVAHQLNTPLAVIMMRLQMLKEDLATVAKKGTLEQLDSVVNSSRKMSTIIQDLLGFSRVSKLQKETVQIENLLNQILNFVEVRARQQNVNVVKDFPENPTSFEADKNRLEQAFLNIIVNALDAMPDGGTLAVGIGKTKISETNYATIEFRDTGTGIATAEISKIFDPFFTTKPAGQGTGLGLSVTYEIIRSHGGDVQVESKKGEGALFRILLPLAE